MCVCSSPALTLTVFCACSHVLWASAYVTGPSLLTVAAASKLDCCVQFQGQTVLVGVDDMDLFKGIELKLLSVERVLDHHPEWRGKLVLIQVTNAPRLDVTAQQSAAAFSSYLLLVRCLPLPCPAQRFVPFMLSRHSGAAKDTKCCLISKHSLCIACACMSIANGLQHTQVSVAGNSISPQSMANHKQAHESYFTCLSQ